VALNLPALTAQYLLGHHVMTLATQGAEGPWAAAVFYVQDADDLIFLSSPSSRHCRDLALQPRCAATIQSDTDDWRSIQGIQLEGRVSELSGEEKQRAQQLYAQRFPFVRPGAAPVAIVSALARVRWYRLRISRLYFIDNARGFGQREQFDS
jgi:uncharacterized protein